jgi:hypothetical protein
MKKIILLLAAILTLSGCAMQDKATTQSGKSEPLIASGSVGEPAEKEENAEATYSVIAESEETEAANDETADTVIHPVSPPVSAQPTDETNSEPPSSGVAVPPPAPSPATPEPAEPAIEEPAPALEPPAISTPEPTEPQRPKTAYDSPYDTAQIVADARAYGESIGMTWCEPLTVDNCSWEAPGSTSPVLSGDRLREGIEGGIRRVKKLQADNGYQPGEFLFKLLLVPDGTECTIYWLMG